MKCRTFVHLAFGPDASAMPEDDSLNVRQSDSRPVDIPAVQPFEHAENLLVIIRVNPDSVVAY